MVKDCLENLSFLARWVCEASACCGGESSSLVGYGVPVEISTQSLRVRGGSKIDLSDRSFKSADSASTPLTGDLVSSHGLSEKKTSRGFILKKVERKPPRTTTLATH